MMLARDIREIINSNSSSNTKIKKIKDKLIEYKNYSDVHKWLNKTFIKLNKCEICNKEKRTFWCLKKGFKYEKNKENFLCLCGSCHVKYDFTDTQRERLKNSHLGKKLTEEHKNNISKNNGRVWLGKKHTKEHREKITISRKYKKLKRWLIYFMIFSYQC